MKIQKVSDTYYCFKRRFFKKLVPNRVNMNNLVSEACRDQAFKFS